MPLFRELISASTSTANLQSFVINNIQRFHNLSNGHYYNILNEKNDIRDFIELKSCFLADIDFELSQCKAFISIIFDFCERFGFICTVRIENTLSHRNLNLGCRREAAKLFLLQLKNNSDYVSRFDQICTYLQCSIEIEEDNEVKPVITFLNYLAKVIRDTSEEIVNSVRSKVSCCIANNSYPFLNNPVIQEICEIPLTDIDSANTRVQEIIEAYLGHLPIVEPDIEEVAKEIIIESDTPYSSELLNTPVSFERIRRIAVDKCRNVPTILQGRGVTPLRSEMELFIYLKSYGNMHKSKLQSAFEAFPFNNINLPVEIIDWGCGQALASLVLIDYLRSNNIPVTICKIILIEPSELSLKRAALHVSLVRKDIPLRTVCNVFDSLSDDEIYTSANNIKFHLFSNVLDIDESIFSQSNLIKNIVNTQQGTNFFFCISPYINDEKTDRVDAFKRYFHQHYDSFEYIFAAENSKRIDDDFWNCNNNRNNAVPQHGCYQNCLDFTENGGCINKWTRVIRVFKVEL